MNYNVSDDLKHFSVKEIYDYQQNISKPWAAMALNITGDLNAGVIGRTACAFGAKTFYLVGKKRIDKRSMVGTQNYINIKKIDALDNSDIDANILDTILTKEKLYPIFIEQGGENLKNIFWKDRLYPIIESGLLPVIIVGNEGMGISDDVLALQSKYNGMRVSINQIGVTRSLNVSSAFSIASSHLCMAMNYI